MIPDQNVVLSKYSSWKVGGVAQFFVLPRSVEDIIDSLKWAQKQGLPITVLSGGTNSLISDQGISGLVICLRKFSGLEVIDKNERIQLNVHSGTSKSELLKVFLKYKLAPALFLSGLPGDVGGGIVMNAGVSEPLQPREFEEIVDWVEVLSFENLQVHRFEKGDLNWSYRRCTGWAPGIIVRVGLSWKNEPLENILEKVRAANKKRMEKQPLEFPNCGSVFVNPSLKQRAGSLIDQCGLKGLRVGGAQISEKHANFIINLGEASAENIFDLISLVQRKVKEKTGIALKTEVVPLGDWSHRSEFSR